MYFNDLSSKIDKNHNNQVDKDELKQYINDQLRSQIDETQKSTLINARVGQGQFRKKLIDYWNGCAVTGFTDTRFLVASHIKPWRSSSDRDRLNEFNGLLLLPNLDKAFDLGFISFNFNAPSSATG